MQMYSQCSNLRVWTPITCYLECTRRELCLHAIGCYCYAVMAKPRRKPDHSAEVEQVQKRIRVVASALKQLTSDQWKEVKTETSYGGHSYHTNLITHIQQWGTLENAPREREATVYTENVLKAAVKIVKDSDVVHTAAEVLTELQDKGLIPEGGHDATWFTGRLQLYAHNHDIPLKVGWIHAISYLHIDDVAPRKAWCDQLKARLLKGSVTLEDIVFVDETIIDEHQHQKSE